MNERMLKLEELIKDETKVAEIFTGSPDEIMKKLAMNGIDLTQEEFDALYAGMHEDDNGEILSEADLNAVAGGCDGCYNFCKKIGKAVDKVLQRIFGH